MTGRVALSICSAALVAGCAYTPMASDWASRIPSGPVYVSSAASLTEAQACAIGYDLAREIHDRVSLRRTVILAPRRQTDCEKHALEYLRRAGFRIDETGRGGLTFDVQVDRMGADTVSALATIGGSLRIGRVYRPVRTGVIAATAVSVQELNPDTYGLRGGV